MMTAISLVVGRLYCLESVWKVYQLDTKRNIYILSQTFVCCYIKDVVRATGKETGNCFLAKGTNGQRYDKIMTEL